VNVSEGVWFCHHCGWSGGLKKQDENTYKPKRLPRFASSKARPIEFFAKRGISAETLKAESVDVQDGDIRFPYFKGGRVVNIKYRGLREKKFRQAKGAESCLYRFDKVANGNGALTICEGEIDALSCIEAGIHNATSIPDGAPDEHAKNFNTKFDFLKSAMGLFDKYDRIIIATDADGPGRKADAELVRRIGVERCFRVQCPAGCKDLNDVLVKLGKDAVATVIEKAKPVPVTGVFKPSDLRQEVLELFHNGLDTGLSTGWKSLDKYYRVAPGQFNVVTGIPGHGKSEFMDALMLNMMTIHDWRFAVFSPENHPTQLHIAKLAEKEARLPFFRSCYAGRMSEGDLDMAMRWFDDRLFFVNPEDEELTLDNILSKVRVLVRREGVKGVILDPWNEFEHRYDGRTEAQYHSAAISQLRRFARSNGVALWVVAHPTKLLPKKKDSKVLDPPGMYDISGGAHWFNKADNGLCIHREDFTKDETQVIVQKVRFKHLGQKGIATFKYCRDTGVYTEKD
jgi:twinkle protein